MDINALRQKKGYICDMDGVIYHGNKILEGAAEFVEWLKREEKNYLFSLQTPANGRRLS